MGKSRVLPTGARPFFLGVRELVPWKTFSPALLPAIPMVRRREQNGRPSSSPLALREDCGELGQQ